MNQVVVGFGSNIHPEKNIRKARTIFQERFQVLAESQFIRTAPIGFKDQEDFINGSVLVATDLEQAEFNSHLKAIEEELGRVQSDIKFGPRSIDLDIVIWNGTIMDEDFYTRDFLKNAALELIPDLNYEKSRFASQDTP